MYLIYNETGRALKLTTYTQENGTTTELRLGIANENGEFDIFSTISTMNDTGLAKAITGFCEKCTEITNKTSRFFFRHPEKKVVSYNPVKCEVVAFDKEEAKIAADEGKFNVARNPRNCIITVLNKTSMVKVNGKLMAGHVPAKTITVGDFKILIMFAKANNWSTNKGEPNYFYVDGINGKMQIRMGFVKTGPDKKYTTNNLTEEVYQGEEFPEDVQRPTRTFVKKSYNNNRTYNKTNTETTNNTTPMAIPAPAEFTSYKDNNRDYNRRSYNNDNFHKDYDDDYEDNRRNNKRGNPHKAKKNRNRNKFNKYNDNY